MVGLSVRLDPSSVGTNYCVLSPNSAGPGAEIRGEGSTSLAAANLTLEANGCPAKQNGLFFYGSTQVQIPFGDGYMCAVGNIKRCPLLTTSAVGTASHELSYDHSPITAGSTWNFQFWFRDPLAGGSGFNLSNGLTATFVP